MSSSDPQLDPVITSLRALSRTSQPEMLPSRSPIQGPSVVVTQVLTSILLLVY